MISVIMGVYNGEKTIEKAILSLCSTEGIKMEIIVVDDGSTDRTYKILRKLRFRKPNLKIIRRSENQGLASALNLALSAAKGEWIARMDADDISHRDRFKKQLAFLKAHPEYGFVGSSAIVFDDDGEYGVRQFGSEPNVGDLVKGNPFIHPSLLFRKDVLIQAGGYRACKETERCEDYDLLFRLYSMGIKGYNFSEPLIDYREDRGHGKPSFIDRIHEAEVRKRGLKELGVCGFKKLYALKPLILGILPKPLYLMLHHRKIKKYV